MKTKPLSSVSLSLAFAAALLAGGCSKQAPQQATSNPQQYPSNQQAPNAPAQQAVNPNAAPAQQTAPLAQQQQATGGYAPAPQQQAAPGYAPAPSSPGLQQQATTGYAPGRAARATAAAPASYTIPAGTHISITTGEELSSKTSQAGQSFSATVARPIVVGGRTLVRSGSSAHGTVVAAKSQGRFKGSGELDLRLDTISADGRTYDVETSSIERVEKGKGKRTTGFALGGGGGGALIGGLAGGGKGALLGGLLGAGGGTAVNAFTGNKQVVVPAETTLTFRLERSVTVGR